MKHLLATLSLAFALCSGPALATPPSPAQVERLLQVMEAEAMTEQMVTTTMEHVRTNLQQPTAQADLAKQEAFMREMLAWDVLKPIYIRVYTQTLEAGEVEALTAFYSSPEGRSVMAKLPLLMQRSMQEIQPHLQNALQKMMGELESEKAAGDDK